MTEPRSSVVVVLSRETPFDPTLFQGLDRLRRAGEVELVLVAHRDRSDPPAPVAGVRQELCAPGATVPEMRALGLRTARADLVSLLEGFCRPASGWAESILAAAHSTTAVAIGGPVTRRAGRAADWAVSFAEYGRFAGERPAGPTESLPGANLSFDRRRLRDALGAEPQAIAEAELLPWLRSQGQVLWWEPRAVVLDHGRRPFGSALAAMFHHGRLFGARRVLGRSRGERLARCAAAPLVPLVQVFRIARGARRAKQLGPLLRALPHLGLLLVAWALGEARGSLFGEGDSARRWT